jgi:hypothetical protein
MFTTGIGGSPLIPSDTALLYVQISRMTNQNFNFLFRLR